MRDDGDEARAALRRLPPAAVAGLREAFAGELAERLPRLRAAAASGDVALLAAAVRDAHSLGSSAAVVGEADASRAARAAESELLAHAVAPGERTLAALRGHGADLSAALDGWTP